MHCTIFIGRNAETVQPAVHTAVHLSTVHIVHVAKSNAHRFWNFLEHVVSHVCDIREILICEMSQYSPGHADEQFLRALYESGPNSEVATLNAFRKYVRSGLLVPVLSYLSSTSAVISPCPQ